MTNTYLAFFNKAFGSFWYDYIIFNGKYSSTEAASVMEKIKSFIYYGSEPIVLISFLSIILNWKYKNKKFNVCYLIYMLFSILFICISGRTSGHYGMVLIPAIVYPLSLVIHKISEFLCDNLKKIFYKL